jgi:hypothetical protein
MVLGTFATRRARVLPVGVRAPLSDGSGSQRDAVDQHADALDMLIF